MLRDVLTDHSKAAYKSHYYAVQQFRRRSLGSYRHCSSPPTGSSENTPSDLQAEKSLVNTIHSTLLGDESVETRLDSRLP